MIHLARHQTVLTRLGLSTLDEVRAFRGDPVRARGEGRRDILRIETCDATGGPLVLFLKRTWRAHQKDGLRCLLQHGKVWSIARQEWENSRCLQRAELRTAPLVAYGEECGWWCEHFSFLITESVEGEGTLEQFLRECINPCRRRTVLDALARKIRKMHNAGLAMPDLFGRHIFLELAGAEPEFSFIDVARLNQRTGAWRSRRARDLAALNITAPLRHVAIRERLRFLQIYDGRIDRKLVSAISTRMTHLLRRRKHAGFYQTAEPEGSLGSGLQLSRDIIRNSSPAKSGLAGC